jgi:hypothetical protein
MHFGYNEADRFEKVSRRLNNKQHIKKYKVIYEFDSSSGSRSFTIFLSKCYLQLILILIAIILAILVIFAASKLEYLC